MVFRNCASAISDSSAAYHSSFDDAKKCVRPGSPISADAPIGRLGGEEFALVLRGHSLLYTFLFVGLFLPLSIIPMYAEARMLGMFNNRIGYTILHIEQPGLPGLPLAVVVLTASLASVPLELDEAAWMEGASYLAYLGRVIVPLTRPALLISFLYAMLGVWNDIIGPAVLLADPGLAPVTKGIYSFYGSNESQFTLLAAGVVIVSLPVVLLFIASQRQINRASLVGGVKG